MKKRNAIFAAALAGIMLVSGCSSNEKKAETSASETTTTASETTAEPAPADDAKADVTDEAAAESEDEVTEPEDVTEDDGQDIDGQDANTEVSDAPFGETVIQEGVDISFTETVNAMKNIIGSDKYTFGMDYNMAYGEQDIKMSMLVVQDPELGTYSDTNMLFIVAKMIKRPDGTLLIIDDTNKNYVSTTEDESGSKITNDTSQAFIPVKEDVRTADLVQFPDDSKKYYRFFITKENMVITDSDGNETEAGSNGSDAYMYFDADTLYLTNMYMLSQGSEVRSYITISPEVDKTLFDLPADYTEISYEEYQQNMMSSFGSSFGELSESE